MSRLAGLVEGGRSMDIIAGAPGVCDPDYLDVCDPDYLERRKQVESGPVKESIDLSLFRRFGREHQQSLQKKMWTLCVKKDGEIRIGSGIGERLQEGATVAFYLNAKGTILVLREEPDGVSLGRAEKDRVKSQAKRATIKALAAALQETGAEFPVRFHAEWNEELKAWVGRR